MKLLQLVERIRIDSDRVENPIGLPPDDIYDIMDELWDIEGAFHTVVNQDDDDLPMNLQARKTSEEIEKLGKPKDMAVSDLIPMEAGLDPEHLKVAHLSDKLATVYLYKGKYYINDGNHRVASMFQKGLTHIHVNVVDVNDIISATRKLAS